MSQSPRSLRAALTDVLRNAEACVGAGTHVQLGPVPLLVHASNPSYCTQVLTHALDPAVATGLPPLSVYLVDGDAMAVPPGLQAPDGPGPTTLFTDGHLQAFTGDDMLWVVDLEASRAVRWTTSATTLPAWEAIRPLRYGLKTWAAHHGAALLHAGAVAGSQGAALLIGPSGTGKSTTSLACLGQGLHVLSDDYCIGMGPGPARRSTVSPTYLVGHLDGHSLDLLPHLRDRVVGVGPRDKRLVPLDPLPSSAHPANLTSVIAIDRRSTLGTSLEPISRIEALRILAPSTMLQVAGSPRETWAQLKALTDGLDTFRLHVGNLHDAPRALTDLLGAIA